MIKSLAAFHTDAYRLIGGTEIPLLSVEIFACSLCGQEPAPPRDKAYLALSITVRLVTVSAWLLFSAVFFPPTGILQERLLTSLMGTILASGEAIVFGSAFHVPARVQFDRPEPGPYSQTAAPYYEWKTELEPFPLDEVFSAWGLNLPQHSEIVAEDGTTTGEPGSSA